jgi:hypothetical protein
LGIVRADPAASLDARRLAVVAALRAVQDEPKQPDHRVEIAALQSEVRRLADRLSRVEDTVELIQESEDAPLAWPTSVDNGTTLEVPPLEVSRKSSPAFDVLLGPSPAKKERDSA